MLSVESLISSLNWQREPQGLYAPIAYTLASGGKRVRPTLALIAAGMYGAEEKAVPAALALEIFHNFTLLHDDLMDNAPVRRGRETVHVRWDANTAVLSGDQMLIEAYKQLEGVPADKLPEVLRLFSKMATEICEGQQYDVDFESREDVTIAEYTEMIRLKTSVLLGTALEIGAVLADAPEADRKNLYAFGVNIGLAFQIQDDVLDVWGDPVTFGKQIGGDILLKKKSMALLSAYELASAEQRVRLDEAFCIEEPQRKIAAVTALYNELGVRAHCEEVMLDYTHKALAHLADVPRDTAALRVLAEKLSQRNK